MSALDPPPSPALLDDWLLQPSSSTDEAILRVPPGRPGGFDLVALGEVMLRFDPGEGRVRTARSFRVSEGGGEYNVARGLRRTFGLRTAIATAFVRNDVGLLLEDLVLQGGVDTALIQWVAFDGVGRVARNGLNFTERGFGVRGASGTSDRGHTAAAAIRPGDIEWRVLFEDRGCRWFHTGGIFAALSTSAADAAEEAIAAARTAGAIVSYDLNYRPSLWASAGGLAEARRVNRRLVAGVDVLLGNEEDFLACLGLDVPEADPDLVDLDAAAFGAMIERLVHEFPNLRVVGTSLRGVRSATRNDWGAVAWSAASGLVEARRRTDLEVLDRVGGGDSFASGLIFGLLDGRALREAVELGAAHGALAMTTPGDTSMVSAEEVERLAAGGNARVRR